MYGAKKIVTLSENGSVPYPDSMKADGANWSWFMPWYGDYAMEGWANDNNAESWKTVMNNDYIITLEDMPGWDNYEMQTTIIAKTAKSAPTLFLAGRELQVNLNTAAQLAIYDLQGNHVLTKNMNGSGSISLSRLARGQYIVQVKGLGKALAKKILIK
jgi:mannan endo-1,4-beta-mannosidase